MSKQNLVRHAAAVPQAEPDYRALVQAAGDIIYTLDLQGRFTSINDAAERVLGISPADGLGRLFTDFLTSESARVAMQHFGQGLSGIESSPFFEVDAVCKSGNQVRLEIRAGTLFSDGVLVGRQGIARDISLLSSLQREVATKTERLALLEERTRIALQVYERIASFAQDSAAAGQDSGQVLQQVHQAVLRVSAEKIGLTKADLNILTLLARGHSNTQIAEAVHLSPHTIKDHVQKIMQRLGAKRRAELVARALRLHLITADTE